MNLPTAAHRRIAAVFFLHAFSGAMLHTRVPDIQLEAGLNDATLGLVLMGGPVGAMLAFPFASRAIERLGTRIVTFFAFVALLASIPLMTVFQSAPALFALMAINGIGGSLGAMTFNVEADRVEAALGRRIMNSCHGTWSVGYLIGSAVGGGLRGAGVSPLLHLWGTTPVLLAITAWLLWTSAPAPARAYQAVRSVRRFALPSVAILALVAVGLGAELLEGASRIWSTILLRDSFEVPLWLQSAALPAMVLTMAGGRLLADRWIDRFGPVQVARVLLAIAFVGLTAIAIAPNPVVVIVGFAVAGAGICVIYPLSISAAAKLGDRPASQNVASLTLVIQIVMLVAPMGIGFVAEGFGVRAAFGALLPVIALGWLMSKSLAGSTAASLDTSPSEETI